MISGRYVVEEAELQVSGVQHQDTTITLNLYLR